MSDPKSIFARVSAASLAMGISAPHLPSYPSRGDWSHITHTYTEKPLTKRQKRRLRGKRKARQ